MEGKVQISFWYHKPFINLRERPSRCVLSNLCNILCTVNTQHTSRQDAIITIKLYLATCFGRKRPSSGQLRTILRYSKNSTQWDPISFTLKLDKIWKLGPIPAWIHTTATTDHKEGEQSEDLRNVRESSCNFGCEWWHAGRWNTRRGLKPKSTNYPDHGHHGNLSLQGKIPMLEPGIEPGTSWLLGRDPDH